MNWRRVERWATIALYTAASAAVVIVLLEALLPSGSLEQKLAQVAAQQLTRLGDVGSGALLAIIVIALLVMGGIWIMVLIAEGVSRLSTLIKEIRGQNEQLKAAAREEGLAEGRQEGLAEGRQEGLAEGRDEMRDIVRERLEERGIDPDEILPLNDPENPRVK